ncbi:MAG TPA: pyridoxamine 5'-phosphate oxidase family protein [Acidimicrobiales bacterium]|nr:pyridoxamine 5'-phosphate oxidase family protein [Acidimicrobiales bacterium]
MWVDQRGSEVLPRPECLRLVAVTAKEHAVGRLAVPTEGAPIVVPVNFSYMDETVLVRLGRGTAAAGAVGRLVSFEVDRLDTAAHQGWSVLVRGLARALEPHELHRRWRHLPEPVVPTPGDLLLSVRADVVTGRRFSIGAQPCAAPGDRAPV